jgi:hypothetical protein
MSDSQPPLPRRPDDPERLARLRKEAAARLDKERLDRELFKDRAPAVTYGGPPAAVYGGPPAAPDRAPRPPAPVYGGAPPARRGMIAGIVALLLAGLAAVAAVFKDKWMKSRIAAPVYGGPPIPQPTPLRPEPSRDDAPSSATNPEKSEVPPPPPAAVYGGPPVRVEPPPSPPNKP